MKNGRCEWDYENNMPARGVSGCENEARVYMNYKGGIHCCTRCSTASVFAKIDKAKLVPVADKRQLDLRIDDPLSVV